MANLSIEQLQQIWDYDLTQVEAINTRPVDLDIDHFANPTPTQIIDEEVLVADEVIPASPKKPAEEAPAEPHVIDVESSLSDETVKAEKPPKTRRLIRVGARVVGLAMVFTLGANIRAESPQEGPVRSAQAVKVAEAPAVVQDTSPNTNTAPSTTEVTVSSVATTPETVAGAGVTTVPSTTGAPAPLSFTEQVKTGQRELGLLKGVPIGRLVLADCTPVTIYIENPVDITNPDNIPKLTLDAQTKYAQMHTKGISDISKRELQYDIEMAGIPSGDSGVGSPMYYLQPAEAKPADCVPQLPDTRGAQLAYGSTEADANGGNADQYQAIADILPEFAALPGGGKVTYIQGHRSSQSAAFNNLVNYQVGNTVQYTGDDGISYSYVMTGTQQIDGNMHIEDLVGMLSAQAAGQDMLVLQVCIEGDPNNRALVLFTRV